MLRIAIQAKGRLNEQSIDLLSEAGIGVAESKRKLISRADGFPMEVLYLRDDDIPQAVAMGVADLGIVGLNEVAEKNFPVERTMDLGFGSCRISLAVDRTADYNGLDYFRGKRVATSYPNILARFFAEKGIDAEIHTIEGSVEIAPAVGMSDAIFDIVSSGGTLISNGLVEVEKVFYSEAVLIANPELDEDKRRETAQLTFRFNSILESRGMKYVLMNLPQEKLDEAITILPGMRSPTVLPLAQEGWCSIHAVICESQLWERIERLKALGAEGILVLTLENMIRCPLKTTRKMEMPKIYVNPPRSEWPALTARCTRQEEEIGERVAAILAEVRTGGDAALRRIVRRIEGYLPETFEVTRERRAEAAKAVSPQLKAALAQAKANIEAFHRAQLPAQVEVETMPGVRCVQRAVAIGRAGLYIPGGKAPLFSTVLMLALPARIAGCREVILCTPCGRDGRIAPEILYAADLCGVDRVFALGGAQAVAAMAYGTESIPRVDKIFGPGNRYVTKAKQLAGAADVAVDLPAGPSEVLVLADEDARPEFAAADLLSQAEHGDDSQAMLVCRSEEFARRAIASVGEQAARLSRRDAIGNSLANSRIVVFSDPDEQIAFADAYAPEHLIVAMRDAWDAAARITAAGSVFIGGYSPESAGDYASGTNHTLPTGGWARAYSGVNTESFMRKITYQELTRGGLEALAPTITAMAEAEGLDAHANAVRIRTEGGAR